MATMVALQLARLEPEEVEDTREPPAPRPPEVVADPLPGRRLTRAQAHRRRRLTVLVVVAAVTLISVSGLQALAREPAVPALEPLSSVEETVEDGVYVVQQGDNLWSIARRLAPDSDPRPLVAELRSRHGDVELQVGDRLDLADLLD